MKTKDDTHHSVKGGQQGEQSRLTEFQQIRLYVGEVDSF